MYVYTHIYIYIYIHTHTTYIHMWIYFIYKEAQVVRMREAVCGRGAGEGIHFPSSCIQVTNWHGMSHNVCESRTKMWETVYGGGAGGGISSLLVYTCGCWHVSLWLVYSGSWLVYIVGMLVRDSSTLVRGSYTLWLIRSVAHDKWVRDSYTLWLVTCWFVTCMH